MVNGDETANRLRIALGPGEHLSPATLYPPPFLERGRTRPGLPLRVDRPHGQSFGIAGGVEISAGE